VGHLSGTYPQNAGAAARVKLAQVHGLSETGFLTGMQDHEYTEGRLTTCERFTPEIDVRVTDRSGNEVDAGQPGELVARGANVMRSYWSNPEETEKVFRDGLFRTGNFGYQNDEGYIYMPDRIKAMIVTGGENVYSGEVEAVIYRHPAVREVAVFGIPDPQWGELVTASVVLKQEKSLSADALIAFCRRSLASYKVARGIEFSETDLPKNSSGKVHKRILRERFLTNHQHAVS
jgi:long-chain acyl-CoA synthetase